MSGSTLESRESIKRQLWGPWATAGFGLVVGIIFIVAQTLVLVAFVVAKFISDAAFSLSGFTETLASNGLLLALATIASSVVCTGLVIIIIRVRRSATVADYLGLGRISGKTVLVLLAIAVGLVILSGAVSTLLEEPSDVEFMVDAYRTSVWPALFWVAVVILAPVFEETFFRGFLFVGFQHSRIGPAGTIFLTAIIWALLHLQYSLNGMATIVVMGIVLGLVRLKTGSLWSPMILHVLNNLISTLGTALYVSGVLS